MSTSINVNINMNININIDINKQTLVTTKIQHQYQHKHKHQYQHEYNININKNMFCFCLFGSNSTWLNKCRDRGERRWRLTEHAPADSPIRVMLFGFPPGPVRLPLSYTGGAMSLPMMFTCFLKSLTKNLQSRCPHLGQQFFKQC